MEISVKQAYGPGQLKMKETSVGSIAEPLVRVTLTHPDLGEYSILIKKSELKKAVRLL